MSIAPFITAQMGRTGGRMDWNDGPHWVAMLILALLVLAVLGVAIWAVIHVTRSMQQSAGARQSMAALDLLDQRYARGEIDSTEYEERRIRLRGN